MKRRRLQDENLQNNCIHKTCKRGNKSLRTFRFLAQSILLLALALTLRVHAFKLPPLGSQRDRPPPPPPPSSSASKVLVVGATGRVGGLVVKILVSRGYQVVALARDPDSAPAKALALLPLAQEDEKGKVGKVTIMKGDVTDPSSLLAPIRGCVACIAVSGASRVTQPLMDTAAFVLHAILHLISLAKRAVTPREWSASDSFSSFDSRYHSASSLATTYPREHPYNVNYLGTLNLLQAARQAGVPKFIRVTGLSVGYSAFNPITCLLNLVISFAVRWQLAGERAIRASGVDYTVIRPGALTDAAAAPESLVGKGDGGKIPVGRVSREDVACLCVAALESAKASNMTLSLAGSRAGRREVGHKGPGSVEGPSSKSTSSSGPLDSKAAFPAPGPSRGMNNDPLWSYKILLRREGRPDVTPLSPRLHRLGVCIFVTAVSSLGVGLGAGLWKGGHALGRWLRQRALPPQEGIPATMRGGCWSLAGIGARKEK